MSNKPDLTKFRKTLFWDTTFDRIDFTAHSRYVINRVFERGTEEEIKEIIHLYGRDTILENLNRNGNPYIKTPVQSECREVSLLQTKKIALHLNFKALS